MSNSKNAKKRIDLLLVQRGLADSRQRAQAMIIAGEVRVDDRPVKKASETVAEDARIEIFGRGSKYASRGGFKLEGALGDSGMSVEGLTCADIGSSNGGFTDCLMQRGAKRVYAVDVNTKQLDWKLRQDPRVTAIEKNARFLKPDDLGEAVEFVVVDVSFISVAKLMDAVVSFAGPGAVFLILVKPQFELEKKLVGKGGIVRDAALHKQAIVSVSGAAERAGLKVLGVFPSRVTGAEGNQEYFLHAKRPD
ncbi:MAG TPA: TlyA family RNA methyltransferase [Candidatus Acidoferrales bacterium]|nr:TlyA family RNA methyltransferase [Candidatus Acidoferrales bacterium]